MTWSSYGMMIYFLAFVLGACVGSFLNVCIYRIPKGESIVSPRSKCRCGKMIPFYDNIPILSWILLRGKARCCGQAISPRYIIVETLTGLIFLSLFKVYGFTSSFVVSSIFCSILIVIAYIDFDTMEIYDALSIGGMFVGFVCSMISPELMCEFSRYEAVKRSFIGACFGSGLMLWIAVLSEIIFKREAVGFGDVKLMGLIGAFTGVDGSMFSIFGGCLIGSVILVPLLLIKNFSKNKRILKSREIPFAPFLVVGSISYTIFFNQTCSDMLMYFSF